MLQARWMLLLDVRNAPESNRSLLSLRTRRIFKVASSARTLGVFVLRSPYWVPRKRSFVSGSDSLCTVSSGAFRSVHWSFDAIIVVAGGKLDGGQKTVLWCCR